MEEQTQPETNDTTNDSQKSESITQKLQQQLLISKTANIVLGVLFLLLTLLTVYGMRQISLYDKLLAEIDNTKPSSSEPRITNDPADKINEVDMTTDFDSEYDIDVVTMEALQTAETELGFTLPIRTDYFAPRWVSDDGHTIGNSEGLNHLLDISCADDQGNNTFLDYSRHISKILDQRFLEIGLAKNEMNSSEELYNYRQGWEGRGYKVLLHASLPYGGCELDENGRTFGNFFIFITYIKDTEYQKNYAQQLPFARDLGTISGVTSYYIEKIDGNFAMLTLSNNVTVKSIIVKKINGVWTEIWNGSEKMLCSVIDETEIPMSITNTCVDDQSLVEINRETSSPLIVTPRPLMKQ